MNTFKFMKTMKTMKTLKLMALPILFTALFVSCSNDDDAPEIINEEEVITTVTLTLTPSSGTPVVLQTRDLDGDGPNPPVTTVSGSLAANTSYSGAIVFLNETESPAENVTEEVLEEADEHQVFYGISSGLNITTSYEDTDGDGNPLGLVITLETGDASNGTLTVTLRHEPTKPNNGINDAGGETDVTTTFDVSVE